ncbi:hypothetical protein BKA81DRAFT_50034 [Phyllosticta paracitricarpa]
MPRPARKPPLRNLRAHAPIRKTVHAPGLSGNKRTTRTHALHPRHTRHASPRRLRPIPPRHRHPPAALRRQHRNVEHVGDVAGEGGDGGAGAQRGRCCRRVGDAGQRLPLRRGGRDEVGFLQRVGVGVDGGFGLVGLHGEDGDGGEAGARDGRGEDGQGRIPCARCFVGGGGGGCAAAGAAAAAAAVLHGEHVDAAIVVLVQQPVRARQAHAAARRIRGEAGARRGAHERVGGAEAPRRRRRDVGCVGADEICSVEEGELEGLLCSTGQSASVSKCCSRRLELAAQGKRRRCTHMPIGAPIHVRRYRRAILRLDLGICIIPTQPDDRRARPVPRRGVPLRRRNVQTRRLVIQPMVLDAASVRVIDGREV